MAEFVIYGWLQADDNKTFIESPTDLSSIKNLYVCIDSQRESSVRNVLNNYTNGGRIMLSLPLSRKSGDLMTKISVSGNGRGTIYSSLTRAMLDRMKIHTDGKAFIGLELAFTVKIRKYRFINSRGEDIAGIRFILVSIDLPRSFQDPENDFV